MAQPFMTDPAAIEAYLRGRDLKKTPRAWLVAMFKDVDAAISGIPPGEGDDAYDVLLRSWYVLADFLDPRHRLVWPDPDWSLLDAAKADTKQMELF